MLTRRQLFAALAAGWVLEPDGKIWRPGERLISVPKPREILFPEEDWGTVTITDIFVSDGNGRPLGHVRLPPGQVLRPGVDVRWVTGPLQAHLRLTEPDASVRLIEIPGYSQFVVLPRREIDIEWL